MRSLYYRIIAIKGQHRRGLAKACGTCVAPPALQPAYAAPAACSDGTLVINGNPNVTAGVQANNNGITTMVNVMIGGGVSFAPVHAGQFPTGSCMLNVTAAVSVNDSNGTVTSSSITGSVCGQMIQ